MNIHLIAVGQRTPLWIREGFAEYAKRLTGECRLHLVEIPAGKRISSDVRKVIRAEGKKMLKAIPVRAHVVALDVNGSYWSTEDLAGVLSKWMSMGKDIALLVGGPDGLASDCAKVAHQSWSLSPLTFPHPLIRVIVAEQLYRALSFLRNHPYHRE
jgi:23S rRNA (pseudouridine1915-N3)-methyltransferase